MRAGDSDPGLPYIVGGACPDSLMSPKDDLPPLTKDKLAQVHACTLLKTVDCRGGGYLVSHTPRKRISSSRDELLEISKILQACTLGNGDMPPLSLACDNHMTFNDWHDFCLGQLPADKYCELPVLGQCTAVPLPVKLPLFGCQAMVYKKEEPNAQPILGCNDPKHILKSWAAAVRCPSRTLKMLLHTLEIF